MTVQAIRGVGFCALPTELGDWAFTFALGLARLHDVTLDVFFFPSSPYEPHAARGLHGDKAAVDPRTETELERELRLYYDERLGDWIKAGFRLCYGDEDPELRRCLLFRKEYDVLVVPYPAYGCPFGRRSLLEFAESMPCPVVLVGPERPGQLHLNSPARHLADSILPAGCAWEAITPAAEHASPR